MSSSRYSSFDSASSSTDHLPKPKAKQTIPALQEQVSSLANQLQSLVDDLSKVKADKYSVSAKPSFQNYGNSPRTPVSDHEETVNFLEFSYSESSRFVYRGFESLLNSRSCEDQIKGIRCIITGMTLLEYEECCFASSETGSSASYKSLNTRYICRDARGEKLSRSSDCCQQSNINIEQLVPLAHRKKISMPIASQCTKGFSEVLAGLGSSSGLVL